MIGAIVGIVLGIAVAFGPLNFLAGPIDLVNEALLDASYTLVNSLLNLGGPELVSHPVSTVVKVFFSTATPGIVAAFLLAAGAGISKHRRLITATLLIGGFSSFFFTDAGAALSLAILAVVVSALITFTKGAFIQIPLAVMATLIATRYGFMIWSGEMVEIGRGAIDLATLTGAESLEMWRIVLTFVGLGPFLIGLKIAFDGKEKKKKED